MGSDCKLYKLDKVVLSIKNNVEKFLFGLTANTLDQPANAFLTMHGKIVATFDQLKAGDDHYLILIEKPFLEPLKAHLNKYILLSKVKIEERGEHVYFDLDGSYQKEENEFMIPHKKGQLVITPRSLETTVSDEEFTLFRLKNNIPVHGIDYTDTFILNVDQEKFVSFTKGCFLGQEPVSKVYSRSKPSSKLMVRFEDECDSDQKSKMTSQAKDPQTGRVMGFVAVRQV